MGQLHGNTAVDGLDATAANEEEIRDEIADLEEYAKRGERPPRCRGYRIRVGRDRFEVHEPMPTRETILTIAGRTPTDNFNLFFKVMGETLRPIAKGERVDLRAPGVEKFKVLPRDQTDGAHGPSS